MSEDATNRILQWASSITAEATPRGAMYYWTVYYWTEPVKKALFRLKTYERYFIGLIGLVGTGKSQTLLQLKEELSGKTVGSFKWKNDLWDSLKDNLGAELREAYQDEVYESLFVLPKAKPFIKKGLLSVEHDGKYIKASYEEKRLVALRRALNWWQHDVEHMLPNVLLNPIRTDIIKRRLGEVDALLIDMPDYSQKGCWKINKDLDDIAALWNLVREKEFKVNIVVCLQQELVVRQPHLILGKMDKIFLKPLTVEQLLEAYKLIFNNYFPFTEDGLRLIAKLSRGVFRRFKNYIRLCLEPYAENKRTDTITPEDVKRCVTKEQLMIDMDLELSDVFKSSEKKRKAFDVIDFLREMPNVNQKTLSEALDIHATLLGKIIKDLKTYGYVDYERGKGKEFLIKLS